MSQHLNDTTLGGIQRDYLEFCKIAKDRQLPIVVMDNDETDDLALLLTRKVSEQMERKVRDHPVYGAMWAHHAYDQGFTDEQFSQIPGQLKECGLVTLGWPEPQYYNRYALLSLHDPELIKLLLEIRPDWREYLVRRGTID